MVPALVWIALAALTALALALGASSRLAALRARRLARQRRELLEDVGLLQAALLPALPGRLGPVGTSAAYRPASGPGAGGDFYDVFALEDGQLAVIVGDVSGHGRQALPHTALLRFTLRAYLEAGLSPRAPFRRQRRCSSVSSGAPSPRSCSPPMSRASACSPTRPPAIRRRRGSGTRSIAPITACSSPPIGAGQPTGRRQTVVSLPGRAVACFYTDGVIEARVGRELFGARRLRRTLGELDGDASASAVLDQVAEQSDRHPDDMAACLLRVEGDELAPAWRSRNSSSIVTTWSAASGAFPAGRRTGPRRSARRLPRFARQSRDTAAWCSSCISGTERPGVVLRPQNVAMLQPPSHAIARAVG